MGLAPYGYLSMKKPTVENLIDIKKDGSFKLNQNFFN